MDLLPHLILHGEPPEPVADLRRMMLSEPMVLVPLGSTTRSRLRVSSTELIVGANDGGSLSSSRLGIDIPFRLVLGCTVVGINSYLMELAKKRQRFFASVQDRKAIVEGFCFSLVKGAEYGRQCLMSGAFQPCRS